MEKHTVIKSEEERIVIGEVYRPLDVDSCGDAMTSDEIKKMAYKFMLKGLQQNIDDTHDNTKTGCVVVESYIAKKDDPDGFAEGSWVIATKILNDDLWKKIKAGERNCYSFQADVATIKIDSIITVPVSARGITEKSSENDILPPHDHEVELSFTDDGKLIRTSTSETLKHIHTVIKPSATEPNFSHSHRMVIE